MGPEGRNKKCRMDMMQTDIILIQEPYFFKIKILYPRVGLQVPFLDWVSFETLFREPNNLFDLTPFNGFSVSG